MKALYDLQLRIAFINTNQACAWFHFLFHAAGQRPVVLGAAAALA